MEQLSPMENKKDLKKRVFSGIFGKKAICCFLAFAIPVMCVIVHMIIDGCNPFGDSSILYGDASTQYIDYYNALIDLVSQGKSILYNFNGGLGENFYVSYAYYLGSPFCYLILLFGKAHLEIGATVILLLQLGLIGAATCHFFLNSKINKIENEKLSCACSVLFACAFTLCDYMMAYQYNIIWLTSFILMPFLLLAIEKLVEDHKWQAYTIILFLVLVTNFYFAWFICLMALLWFVDLYKGNGKETIKSFMIFAGASILAALCACFILIPCYIAVLSKDTSSWITLSDISLGTIGVFGDFITGFFFDYDINVAGSDLVTNNNYCGIFTLFLASAYFFLKGPSLGQKIKRIVEIVILSFSLNWVVTIYILHGFNIPHNFLGRFAFLLFFMLLVTAFEAVAKLDTLRIRWILAIFVGFIAVVMLTLLTASTDNVQSITSYFVTFLVFIYLLIVSVLYKRKSIKYTSLVINILIIGFAEIIANSILVSVGTNTTTTYKDAELTDWIDVYNAVELEDGERISAMVNDAQTWSYSDASIFTSAINTGVLSLCEQIGVWNSISYYYRGTTPLIAALFNVDYVLTDNPSYFGGYAGETNYTTSSGVTYGVLETQYDTSFAFMLPDTVLNWDISSDNPFDVQNNFTNNALGIGDIFTEITFEDMEVSGGSALILSQDGSTYTYLNMEFTGTILPAVGVSITVPYDMDLYVNVVDENQTLPYIFIDGVQTAYSYTMATNSLLHIGQVSAGTEVVVYCFIYGSVTGDTGEITMDFYTFNSGVMDQCVELMNNTQFEIEEFSDTYISGTVTATQETPVLYTSIPYYKGWTVYVDGVATDVTTIGNAFIGVELEAGDHVVEFKYFPYGLKVGIILSIIGICIFVCLWFGRRKHNEEAEVK